MLFVGEAVFCVLVINSVFVAEDEFQMLQTTFMEKYYKEFEDTEENKFIYTDIHKEYVSKISTFSIVIHQCNHQ